MKKLLLLFALTTALPLGRLFAVPNDNGETTGQKPERISLREFSVLRQQQTVTRADDRQGVTATLQYVQLPDMIIPRQGHQAFPTDGGLIVVGGHTAANKLTATAEQYKDGSWTEKEIYAPHDGAYIVELRNKRFLVGGGYSQDNYQGGTTEGSLYNPLATRFMRNKTLSTPRAMCKAINVDGKVYVSGNINGDDSTLDYMEDGDYDDFKPVGQTNGHYAPYMFADSFGRVMVMSLLDNYGRSIDFTIEDGNQTLSADLYDPSNDKMINVLFPFSSYFYPMLLPHDANSADYSFVDNGNHISFILAQQLSQNGNVYFWLNRFDIDNMDITYYNNFIIPTKDEATGQYITWRGSVIVNSDLHEVYLIGTSGPENNQTLHIISFNYNNGNWTIASAGGFKQNMLTSSWTKLDDGRLACTGGFINTTFDQPHASAYIFTPPVAGTISTEPDSGETADHVVIENTNGETVSFLLSEDPHFKHNGQTVTVTMAKVTIDYQTDEIARVYLVKADPTSIDIMEQPDVKKGNLSIEAGRIVITGLLPSETAYVYQLTGTLAATMKADQEGLLVISIDDMPGKVSIIKTKHQSFKIIRK